MWLPRFVFFTSLACLTAGGTWASKGAGLKPEATLTVRVYNFAKAPRETLLLGEETAALIFRRSGIEVRWIDCPTSSPEMPMFPGCAQITDPSARTIKILPQSMSDHFGLPAAKFGLALQPNEAFVFFHRVQEVTKETGFSRPMVLGHIMAHELGHLLLEGVDHSAAGIMQEKLLAKTCERPGVVLLAFAPWQGERMRAQLRR